MKIFRQLGVEIEDKNNGIIVNSSGRLCGGRTYDCGNSGTTMRLLAGALAGQNFNSELVGDESLSKRPMKRIIEPLSAMGARIKSNEGKAPLTIEQAKLNGIEYISPIASAQVKSALLLAGAQTRESATTVLEPHLRATIRKEC